MRVKLKDVCTFYTGTGFPKKYQGQLSGTYPFYKVGDIANNVVSGKVYLEQCNNYISEETLELIKGSIIPKNTIVFAKIGGALKLNRRAITSTDCLIDNNAMGIAAKSDKLRTLFFYYFMRNIKMELLAESTTVPSVRKSRLEAYEIDIPSLDDQKIIEGKLTILSKVINLKEKQLLKLDELVKARFVEMFGDVQDAKKHSDKQLKDICNTVTGGTPSTKHAEYYNGTIPWVSTVSLGPNYIDGTTAKAFITQEAVDNSSTKIIPSGSILFGTRVGVGKSSINQVEMCTNQDIVAIIDLDESKYNKLYIKYVLDTYQSYFDSIKKGATILGISSDDLKNIYIPDASLYEQNRFEKFVKQIDKSRLLNICLKSLVESVLKIRIFSEYKKSS